MRWPETHKSHLKIDGWTMIFLLWPHLFSGANLLLVLGGVSDVSGQFFGSNMCDRVDQLPLFPYNRG